MQLILNKQTYELSEEGLSELKDKGVKKFEEKYQQLPLDNKILLKGMSRTFLMYLQGKYHNDLFKSNGDPCIQMVNILGFLLMDMLKNATINAEISNDTLNIKSIQLESEGESW